MNRRGFLSAVAGAGSVAVLPLAPVIALGRPSPPVPPLPPAADPAPAEIFDPFRDLVERTLDDLVDYVGLAPEYGGHFLAGPADWLGVTLYCYEPRPFRAGGDATLFENKSRVTLDRVSNRGIRLHSHNWTCPEDNRRQAVEQLGDELRCQHSHGARGLVFGRLADVSRVGGAVDCCHVATLKGYSMRGTRAYLIEYDQMIVRFDLLYGWRHPAPVGGCSGPHLLMA